MKMRPRSSLWWRYLQLALMGSALGGVLLAASDDELARRATWSPPTATETRDKFFQWLESRSFEATMTEPIKQAWSQAESWRPDQVLDQLVGSMSSLDPQVKELHDLCERPRPAYEIPPTVFLDNTDLPAWLTANLRLHYGLWLANQQLFDESWEQLGQLRPADVVDPAALLFYQSVAAQRRLEKDQCLQTLLTLLENEAALPQRYAVVARLMQSDLEPLKPDTLDEISRLMDSIQVRLGHGRAGQRVRTEEENVVSKLDKLIEQLEEQANAASAGAAAGGANAPSSPMEDSMPGGGSGPGNIDPKQLGTQTDWGNLPPKEREEALQQLSKDLPSHYRDVIEEYFRKLARDGERR